MKKNLLSILILALLVVNLVLTAIMMVSVTNTNKKTAELVTSIASVLNLELTTPGQEEEVYVPMSDIVVHDITGSLTIPLHSTDGGSHYIIFNASISLNTKGEGYKAYGETFASYESLIKDAITSAVSKYTVDECNNNLEIVRAEMLKQVKALFGDESGFVYKIAMSDIKTQ